MATLRPTDRRKSSDRLAWQDEGLLINTFGASLRRRFGGRIQRVSIDAGFTCPNVDGAVARGGCNFCDNRSFSPSRRVRLKQVGKNLLSNAVKYSPAGGNITLQTEVKSNFIELRIEDEGIGMTAEQLSHLFEQFY